MVPFFLPLAAGWQLLILNLVWLVLILFKLDVCRGSSVR